jgi:S-adenosylmethionine/arginine decarboxylase-like enzyme
MAALVHKHLIIRAEVDNAPKDEEWVIDWLTAIVDKLNMKVCAGPIAKYVHMEGNRGLTAVVIIETSHIAIHCWDEPSPNLIQFDVYSCGEFDPRAILDELDQFGGEPPLAGAVHNKVEYKFLDREHGLVELVPYGVWERAT